MKSFNFQYKSTRVAIMVTTSEIGTINACSFKNALNIIHIYTLNITFKFI